MRQEFKVLSFSVFFVISSTYAQDCSGRLISAEKVENRSWSKRAINLAKAQMKLPLEKFPTLSSVDTYKIRFHTRGPRNENVQSSGLVLLPKQSAVIPDLLSYLHATRLHFKEAPSFQRFDPEVQALTLLFASNSYIVSLPDYLGLEDSSSGIQYYLNADIQATVAFDMLCATQNFLQDNKIPFSNNLFIAGYSQGAHNAVSLQKWLSLKAQNIFSLRAVSGMSGPYNLTELAKGLFRFDSKTKIDPVFLALALLGMHEANNDFPRFHEILSQPYATTLPPLLRRGNFREISSGFPSDIKKLFNMPFVLSLITGGPEHPFWKTLAANDVDNFKAQAPLLLSHAPNDNVVPFPFVKNSYEKLREQSPQVEFVSLPERWQDHTDAAYPAFIETFFFFERNKTKP